MAFFSKTKHPDGIWNVITASSVGTLIEWYDFYIFGSLAPILAAQFFPKTDPTAALLSTLATFAAGFIVRPFGALVFGRLGDLAGRKNTFLLTLIIMGGSTFAIGLIPGYEKIGFLAPSLVLLLRLLQGLALGGEYGGAATYVAEHAPPGRRGYYTSWIQTTATLGLFLSLGIILLTRHSLDAKLDVSIAKFEQWGWRVPFLLSIFLVAISVYIRLRMKESPLFRKLKEEGTVSVNPLKESFTHKGNLKMVLLALFGATMGQGVVWYTGQFYAQTFLETVCKVDFEQTRVIVIFAILMATPFFIIFGSWSDKVGRKWIMLAGMAGAVFFYRPIYRQMLSVTDLTEIGRIEALDKAEHVIKPIAGSTAALQTTTLSKEYDNGIGTREIIKDTLYADGHHALKPASKLSKLLPGAQKWKLIWLVFAQVMLVTMVYGPIAAFLVELFPTKIRYTSMSLPYHVGNGVFGGLTPFIAVLLGTIFPGDPLVGLWYPIAIAAASLLIGLLYVSNRKHLYVND